MFTACDDEAAFGAYGAFGSELKMPQSQPMVMHTAIDDEDVLDEILTDDEANRFLSAYDDPEDAVVDVEREREHNRYQFHSTIDDKDG